MTERINERLTVVDLAAEVQMSPHHFLRMFRRAVGETPHRHLIRLRVERAKQFLESGRMVSETAAGCGFSSASHFSAVFLRETGVRPSRWPLSSAKSSELSGTRP
ncbi:helix-turn-helix domain-containing protein [Kineosporia corallincola]